jgi:uncharacterized membrane protein YraQ (UPF0718 family)
MQVLVVGLVAAALSAGTLRAFISGNPDLATAGTVFSGVFVQAIPFLALGVVVSGLVATLVSAERLARWLPRRTPAAILAAGIGGAALPGCECGSVPVARRLFGDGVVAAAALTFMLAAPAINPVVLVNAVDVKLFAMQAGMFGRAFAVRFAPTTFVVATLVATGIGLLMMGDAT